MSKERIYKMDDGSWLTSDKKEGVGRDKMNFDAPSWKGREDRITIRIVKKSDTESMKAITFKQKGIKITEVSVSRLEFPISGVDKQILITTNAASINALITGDETSTQLSIESNIKDYVIEIVECESVDKEEIHLDKGVVDLDSDGSPEVINVSTTPENLRWRISE